MIERRVFLEQGAAALVTLGFAPSFLARTALASPARRKVLVAIFQRGAVDGLGMVVPFAEREYYRLRPSIALARPGGVDGVLDLDGFFGLHPRMAPLLPWWQRGHLAIVHACGSPATTRSHFAAQDVVQGALSALAFRPPGTEFTGRDGRPALRGEHELCPDRHHARFPQSPFGRALRRVALLIKAQVGLERAQVESCGWDHHANQGGATGLMASRLDDLARGLDALATDLGDHLADVVILTVSEFGRSVDENGTHGTDHGQGTAMILLGGPVRGGQVYGRWPGLARERQPERRVLAVTTDFRDVCGEVAVRHLGIDWTPPVSSSGPTSSGRFTGCL